MYDQNGQNFEDIALKLFHFQIKSNRTYDAFTAYLGRRSPSSLRDIPFLPIGFFKSHDVKTGDWTPEVVFSSSGTGGVTSHHAVRSRTSYLQRTESIFEYFFGPLTDYIIAALLPSYLEREGSSLVAMADYFIRRSGSAESGFFLNNQAELVERLQAWKQSGRKVLLLGVSFALLDLAEDHPADLSHCMIMETGGMKGRRQEITRQELHGVLRSRLGVKQVLSEYGMTELLSQAYSMGEGRFLTPPGMRVMIRDINDPFDLGQREKAGGINVIDLANVDSCAFIETQDLGKINQDGSFEVLGRIDNSDVRGCNLLVE